MLTGNIPTQFVDILRRVAQQCTLSTNLFTTSYDNDTILGVKEAERNHDNG